MYGLSNKSQTQEAIEKSLDGKTATKYTVHKEVIDLDALRKEKEALEAQLAEKEPSEKELVELGKANHPYFTDRNFIETRILAINETLK